jgi:hypothetical protein
MLLSNLIEVEVEGQWFLLVLQLSNARMFRQEKSANYFLVI